MRSLENVRQLPWVHLNHTLKPSSLCSFIDMIYKQKACQLKVTEILKYYKYYLHIGVGKWIVLAYFNQNWTYRFSVEKSETFNWHTLHSYFILLEKHWFINVGNPPCKTILMCFPLYFNISLTIYYIFQQFQLCGWTDRLIRFIHGVFMP